MGRERASGVSCHCLCLIRINTYLFEFFFWDNLYEGITMTESKCQGNIDCREAPHKQPCPVPLACLFGSCICPWKSHSTFHLVKSNVHILEKKL